MRAQHDLTMRKLGSICAHVLFNSMLQSRNALWVFERCPPANLLRIRNTNICTSQLQLQLPKQIESTLALRNERMAVAFF